ncbi:MAG: ACP S-malonyltransferase [Oligoflexus sp.]
MISVLAMFPGQGSQYVGMGKDLLQEFPYVKEIFEEAEDACQTSIRQLCFDGPDSDLTLTMNTQPCILTVSYAMWKVLVAEAGFQAKIFAGHSLGEYSAVVAADKMRFADAVRLVRIRGKAMQEAVPAGRGAMAAVMKVPADELEDACRKVSSDMSSVEVVNYNSPQQLVVAGHKPAVEKLAEQLKAKKVRCVMLPVSAPFHSRLMQPAREVMAPYLEATEFLTNDHQVICNLHAKPVADYRAEYLIQQIDSPVRWTQSMEMAQEMGVNVFCEIGPGQVLTGLLRRSSVRDDAVFVTTERIDETIPQVQQFLS